MNVTSKKKRKKNVDLFQSVDKPEFVEVGHAFVEKYKMDFIC